MSFSVLHLSLVKVVMRVVKREITVTTVLILAALPNLVWSGCCTKKVKNLLNDLQNKA